jgi:molecular chaperone GrpE
MNENQAESIVPFAAETGSATGAAPGSAPAAVDQVEQLKAELAAAKDQTLRAFAESENVRKRSRREMEEALKFGPLPFVRDLLPVIDNVARAIQAAEKTPDLPGLLAGIRIVAQQLEEALARHHCTKISALHEPFDPNQHAALTQQPSAEFPPQTVLAVLQDGFRLYDRVIRPAQVIVSTSPPDA